MECIFKDNQGNIWIATQAGLNLYDGNSWLYFTSQNGFSSSYPTSIAEDTLGNIWFGTFADGLWYYDGIEFKKHYESNCPNGYITDVFCDNTNRIWAYASGLYVKDDQWLKLGYSYGVVRDINQDLDSLIYIISSQGVYTINKNYESLHYTTDNGIPHNDAITSALINNKLFVGTADGYAYFNGAEWISNATSENGLIHNEVNHIFKDAYEDIWFCTQGGISKFDGIFWESYRRTPQGKEIEWVKSGLQDKNGIYWFTTVHGIFRFDGISWEIYDYNIDEIFSGWGQDIIEDKDGNIWIASFNYILKFDGEEWIHYDNTSGFLNNHCDAIFEDSNGNIWIGSRSQITKWDGNNFVHESPDLLFNNENMTIYSFLEDSEGNIVASTYFGNFINVNNKWEELSNGPSLWHFDSFIDKNDVMWFGTFSGLGKYDGHQYQLYKTADGLAGEVVYSIYRDESSGEIWVGTTQGITHILPLIEVSEIEYSDAALRVQSKGISQPYQYSIDGNIYEYETNQLKVGDQSEVDLYVTNLYDTTVYPNIRIQQTTSLNDMKLDGSVVSPNPSEGIYFINHQGTIRVLDIHGKICFMAINNSEMYLLDIRNHKNGVILFNCMMAVK